QPPRALSSSRSASSCRRSAAGLRPPNIMTTALPAAVPATALEPRYRELFENAALGIYVSRPDGSLIACNAAFARLLAFASIAEAIATNMDVMYLDAADRDRFVAD